MSAIPQRTRWPDERIDDFAAEVHMLKATPIRVATLTEQVSGLRRDVVRLTENVKKLDEQVDRTLGALDAEHAERLVAERAAEKSHRWHSKVASWANAAAVAIGAAVGALVSLFAGGHHP